MDNLADFLSKNEEWLMKRILTYAKERGYTRYTSTLEEAWRLSIVGLSESFIKNLHISHEAPLVGVSNPTGPLTHFAIIESQKHRKRGVTLSMFLGLMKYYRESYLDLCDEKAEENTLKYKKYLAWGFDSIEVAFCDEWTKLDGRERIEELEIKNRFLTNEKNAYLTVFESLNDPVFMTDFDQKLINLNHAADKLISDQDASPGRSYYRSETKLENEKNNVLNENIFNVIPWLPKDIFEDAGTRFKKSTVEVNINGQLKYYEITVGNMLDVSEKFTANIINLIDLTERENIQRELKEAIATKDKFFSIISHDLVSPFNTLLGYSSLLNDKSLAENEKFKQEAFKRFSENSQHLFKLIQNLLDWSRAQTNRIQYSPKNFNISSSTNVILKLLSNNAEKKHISIQLEFPESNLVYADPNMIETVMRNLISNAIKFTHENGTIIITGKPEDNHYSWSIQDDGIGIALDEQKDLFDPAKKRQNLGTNNETGTGLGLLLCSEFIEKNKGRIDLQSEEHKGSIFTIRIPLKK